jgi:hypothetical protein
MLRTRKAEKHRQQMRTQKMVVIIIYLISSSAGGVRRPPRATNKLPVTVLHAENQMTLVTHSISDSLPILMNVFVFCHLVV